MTRAAAAFGPWLAALFGVVAVMRWGVSPALRPSAVNVATLIGMVLLAVPAVRLNEQGRLIARIQSLQKGIEASMQALAARDLAKDKRTLHEASLASRRGHLETTLNELASGKGAWTRPVHYTLYCGYIFLLGSAITRVLA
ncbi:MAG: hypothetical protein ACR2RL_12615 [Gammaproteobacteria bacterium]